MLEEVADIDVVYLGFRKLLIHFVSIRLDLVPHQRLLKKDRTHGIDGKVLQWIES